MDNSIKFVTLALLLFGLTRFAFSRWKRASQRKVEDDFGVAQGCLPMKAVTRGKWPLNIDLVKGLWDANKRERLLAFQQGFVDKLGPNIEQRLLGDVGFATLDPENMKAILTKLDAMQNSLVYESGNRRDALLPFLGEGIFTQDGTPWKKSRKLLQRQFVRLQYHKLDIFSKHVDNLITRLSSEKTSVVDLQPLFYNYALDTTTDLLFGDSANSLKEESVDSFGSYFDEASRITAFRMKLMAYYWIYTPRRYLRACDEVKAYADEYVKKALEKENKGSDRYWFIQNLYGDLKHRGMVRDQLVNVLIAGRDSTACLLSWAVRLLVRHESVLIRLRRDIEAVVGADKTLRREHLQKLPYLRNVIDETLRLYPSLPLNVRVAAEATTLPRGGGPDGLSPVLVRKGQGVGMAIYHMHRRKDFYGPGAHLFRPERWEDGALENRIGWGYLPFSGGPRICLGKDFAILETSYAVVRILQAFPTLKLPPGEAVEPVGSERQTLALVVSPADGCRVKLRS